MPKIPSVLSLGSWPIGVFPRHLPSRIAMIGTVACLSAPSRRKMPTSAVALSTAIGVLDIRIPVAVSQDAQEYVVSTGNTPFWFRASTSTLSYPAPLWQIYLSDLGRRETNSLSKGPVSCHQVLAIFFHTLAFEHTEVELFERYSPTTPSYSPCRSFCRKSFLLPATYSWRVVSFCYPKGHFPIETFKLYFEEYSFHSLFVCVSPPISSTVFFDIMLCW